MSDLGKRLRAAREDRNLGLRATADQIGVSFNTLSRIERGADCRHSHAEAIWKWLRDTANLDDEGHSDERITDQRDDPVAIDPAELQAVTMERDMLRDQLADAEMRGVKAAVALLRQPRGQDSGAMHAVGFAAEIERELLGGTAQPHDPQTPSSRGAHLRSRGGHLAVSTCHAVIASESVSGQSH
jgi:transcriptional regulator with XRE-family HTH domain